MDDVIAELRARLAVLEAKEAVLATFQRYTYFMDVGYPAELVSDVFTTDAVFEAINFPPGSMEDLVLTGHDEIRGLFDDHTRVAPAVQGGHHTTNVAVEVAPDASVAWLSAYFLTALNGAGWVQGGQYQGEAVPDGDRWRFRHYRVLSGWGWGVERSVVVRRTESLPAERAWWGARPAGSGPREQ